MRQSHKADTGARRAAWVGLAAITLAGASAVIAFEAYRETWLGWVADDRTGRRARGVLVVIGLGASPLLAWSVWIWRFGRRVVRDGRHPPAEARVARDTPIVIGDAARRCGRLFQALAVLLGSTTLALFWFLWRLGREL